MVLVLIPHHSRYDPLIQLVEARVGLTPHEPSQQVLADEGFFHGRQVMYWLLGLKECVGLPTVLNR